MFNQAEYQKAYRKKYKKRIAELHKLIRNGTPISMIRWKEYDNQGELNHIPKEERRKIYGEK